MRTDSSKSPHILNTSSNLLGLCFIVLTSLKIGKLWEASIIDELTGGAILFFMVSSILSFLSIRSTTKFGPKYEKIAEVFFLTGLLLMFVTTLMIVLNLIE